MVSFNKSINISTTVSIQHARLRSVAVASTPLAFIFKTYALGQLKASRGFNPTLLWERASTWAYINPPMPGNRPNFCSVLPQNGGDFAMQSISKVYSTRRQTIQTALKHARSYHRSCLNRGGTFQARTYRAFGRLGSEQANLLTISRMEHRLIARTMFTMLRALTLAKVLK